MKMIGIVGGMGPIAGLDLSKKIVNQTLASRDQDHISQVLYSAPKQIGDRTDYLLGKINENPAFAITEILIHLESIGATVAGIPCNTAHTAQIFEVIEQQLKQKNASIKLIHMIDEVGRFIVKQFPKLKKIGVLGTLGTYKLGLFDSLEKFGLEIINLSEKEAVKVHQAVYNPEYGLKSVTDEISGQAMNILDSACQSLIKKEAQIIILGCTELPLAFPYPHYDHIPMVDTTMVLARALISDVDEAKLRVLE